MLSIDELERNDELSDEQYECYNPTGPVTVFGCEDIDPEIICIRLDENTELYDVLKSVNDYLEFLSGCKKTIRAYFEAGLSRELSEDWIDDMEIYGVDITVRDGEDCLAEIRMSVPSLTGDGECTISLEGERVVSNF